LANSTVDFIYFSPNTVMVKVQLLPKYKSRKQTTLTGKWWNLLTPPSQSF